MSAPGPHFAPQPGQQDSTTKLAAASITPLALGAFLLLRCRRG